jgi:prolyl-tRNA synthetase
MKDNKALQMGTSHNLGQNFAKAFDVRYQTEGGEHEYVWSTSWGVSTRLIGALIMAHGDDTGLILPPRLAPVQVVIVPIWRNDEQKSIVLAACEDVVSRLTEVDIRAKLDVREGMNPGAKYYDWERRGVPVRLEVGPRDVEAGHVMSVRRFTPDGEERKKPIPVEALAGEIPALLARMQDELLVGARDRREACTTRGVESMDEFRAIVDGPGGFVFTGWCGDEECESRVKDETKATIRVIPDEEFCTDPAPTRCLCGAESRYEVVRAKAY